MRAILFYCLVNYVAFGLGGPVIGRKGKLEASEYLKKAEEILDRMPVIDG